MEVGGYIQGRSYYLRALKRALKRKIKQSLQIRLTQDKSAWDKHGIISHPNFEGFVSQHGKALIKVFKSKLHWNDKGEIHIVPVKIKE